MLHLGESSRLLHLDELTEHLEWYEVYGLEPTEFRSPEVELSRYWILEDKFQNLEVELRLCWFLRDEFQYQDVSEWLHLGLVVLF